ncbi:cytosine methyltransferase [Niastella vici]|uniref:DNA (cytosine-5-)-methyltransferase n=1 Tax=Niastella vici TaxID=1703345 RepID=A0A1V9FUG9_9BACT|nr:cytosine methyltransferase [Niastella vici]
MDPTGIIERKIERFRNGENLRLLDLFSGCGGLSLGFSKQGYENIAAVEMDQEAATSHALNFHKDHPLFKQYAKARDITKTTPAGLFKDLGLKGEPGDQVDIIIGGPPCQAFTRIGRAKLRAVFSDADAFLNDPRSQLYKRYLKYVKTLQPLAILMENVPDMLNYGGVNIADLVCDDLTEYGYTCRYTLLNTVYYGLPQMRERMFLIAVHSSIRDEIEFPLPTHFIDLPRGYHGSRSVALKHIDKDNQHRYYMPMPEATSDLLPAVSAAVALSDLPVITAHLKNGLKNGIRKMDEQISYSQETAQNAYQTLMRKWPGYETNGFICGNVIRILPRDYPVFKKMKAGDQYPQALAIAVKSFKRKLKKLEKEQKRKFSENSKEYKLLLKQTVPPYDDKKFPNKWRKMEADKPARTLMAHLGKDSYSHIHYDSNQARTISVREAARLQSFPDGFQFAGAMNAAFRQIGNAVPPLMAEQLAATIKNMLNTPLDVR